MKQYYYQNNYGVVACKKVCRCAPIFNFFCGPPKFFHRGKFIPKIVIFRDFCGCRPTFLKLRTVKFGMRVQTWDSLYQAKFCKNRLRGYTPFGQIYTKNTNFGNFIFFKSTVVKFGMRVGTRDTLPKAKCCKNRLRGYTPFGQIYTENYQFRRFWGL